MTRSGPPTPTPGDVEAYIAALREGGEADGVRQFSIDRGRAREQLERFRLAEPEQYVTELIQAAVASGASRVDVEIDADDVRLRFDGPGFGREDLELLYEPVDPAHGADAAVARHQLGLGLTLALAVGPKTIRLTSARLDGGVRLVLSPGQPDHYESVAELPPGTTIHLRRPATLRVAVKAAQNVLGTLPEERIIRERCAHSPVEITLDGEVVSRPDATPSGPASARQTCAAGTLAAGFTPSDRGASVLHLVQHGVLIDTVELEGCVGPEGFVAVAWTAPLRRDLALQRVVRNEALSAWIDLALQARDRALHQLKEHLCQHADPLQVPAWLRRVARQALAHGLVNASRQASRLPLWPAVTRGPERAHLTLEQLRDRARDHGQLDAVTEDGERFSDARIRDWSAVCLVLADDAEREALVQHHGLNVVVLEPDALRIVSSGKRWQWLRRLRFLRWPATAAVVVATVALVLYMVVVSERLQDSEASRPEPAVDHRAQCNDGGAEACMRHARALVKAGAPTALAEVQWALDHACELGNRIGCRDAAALRAPGASDPSAAGRRHLLQRLACRWGSLAACRATGRGFDGLSATLRGALQRADERRCDRHGYRQSCFRAGVRHVIGHGVKRLPHTGRANLKKACGGQLVVACAFADTEVGENLQSEQAEAWAAAYLERACALKNLEACSQLSVLLHHGWGLTEDRARALVLARRACKGGVALACRREGNALGAREGKTHAVAALGAYERACTLGDAQSCDYASEAYGGTKPVVKDQAKAAAFDRRSCLLDSGLGCYNLGLAYERGWGVKRDLTRARDWYGKACALSYDDGCLARDALPPSARARPRPRTR